MEGTQPDRTDDLQFLYKRLEDLEQTLLHTKEDLMIQKVRLLLMEEERRGGLADDGRLSLVR